MAFGRRRITLPKTKAACQKLWDDATPRKLAKGYLTVAGDTELHIEYGVFTLKFHGHDIVKYLDGYKTVYGGGYSTSPTTQGRITSATGASMHSNGKLGYEQTVRIGGYPFFDGIRVDDYGQVLEEDRRPDFKQVNVKAVVSAYTTLFKRIEKLIYGRYELGEWADGTYHSMSAQWDALLNIEDQLATGDAFPDSDDVRTLLSTSVRTDLRERLTAVKEALRDKYYARNNGYERIEVTK